MKKVRVIALFTSLCMLGGVLMGFAPNQKTDVTVKAVCVQVMSCDEWTNEVIAAYTNTGWKYNKNNNQVEREVEYKDQVVHINGEAYVTDANGEVVVKNVNKSDSLEVVLDSFTTRNKAYKQTIDASDLNKSDVIVLKETVSIDEVMRQMRKTEFELQVQDGTGDGETQIGECTDGVRPAEGAYVHCNRFNGWLGDGKYYNKSKHPVKAVLNFTQSDCDVALANSTACLADYGSNPYCSTKNTTSAGRCSSIVGHSQKFHMHTGFFSPTGK